MMKAGAHSPLTKTCVHCGLVKSVREFKRRTGRKSRAGERRGVCRECRRSGNAAQPDAGILTAMPSAERVPKPAAQPSAPAKRSKQLPGEPDIVIPATGFDLRALRPDRTGVVRMRGRTDKGKRWLQPTDMETATTLVVEKAAVVVSPHTIRRLFTNKEFRDFILKRDQYTCFFCGEPGDTIDHLVPRSKGGHTTPLNCVCACNPCNQSKANQNLADYLNQ